MEIKYPAKLLTHLSGQKVSESSGELGPNFLGLDRAPFPLPRGTDELRVQEPLV